MKNLEPDLTRAKMIRKFRTKSGRSQEILKISDRTAGSWIPAYRKKYISIKLYHLYCQSKMDRVADP